jgi:hypothetical protein
MSVGEKSVIFLLGAGCSYDATVPVSKVMIENWNLFSNPHIMTICFRYIIM